MVSPGRSNDEEGEIFERVSEKAPPSLPSVSGHVVDRSSRNKDTRSPTRDRTPSRYEHDDSRVRKRQRSGDRGRDAPGRHDRYHSGRGDRYERRAQVSYADIDAGRPNSPKVSKNARNTRDSGRLQNSEQWHRDSKRQRTTSRSPARSPRRRYNDDRSGYPDDRRKKDGRDRGYDRKADRDYERRDDPDSDWYGRHGSGRRLSTSRENRGYDNSGNRSGNQTRSEYLSQSHPQGGPEAHTKPVDDSTQDEVVEPVVVDEEKLIEERRKRREAIKAKYKGQGTPLAVTAALSSANSPASINSPIAKPDGGAGPESIAVNDSASKMRAMDLAQSPSTPVDISREDSPSTFTIAKDVSQENAKSDGDDGEPSAADFDPVRDMEEEHKRHEERAHKDDPEPPVEAPIPQPKDASQRTDADDDFDMFAEGDDDDMFAVNPPVHDQTDPNKVLPLVAQGKQIQADQLDNWDDHEGYYRVILAEMLDGRYHVQANLGKGSFASVIRAFDTKTERLVAIKMIRNNETLKKAGTKEITILRKLEEADPEGKKHIVRFERQFEHKGHLCMVFEHLSINLREVLKKFGRDVGINLKAVRAYAQQIFLGLAHLKRCNILHADLKPDNVLVNEARNILKICDLGSASDASENEITPYLASRFYRAPEIILGVPYDFAIDTWAAGCTLYELYTGKILFTGRSNNQMLRAIMECRGKFSHKMLKRGHFTGLHFDENLNFRSVEQDKITGKDIIKTINILKPTRELKTRIFSSATTSGIADNSAEVKELHLFIDLLDKCLNLNPEKRCTPTEALRHPFISRVRP